MSSNIQILDGTGAAQTVKTTDNAGVHTPHQNVDAVIPGTGATNLGKAEDAPHTSGDSGVMALAVRNDAGGSLAGTDLDYVPLTTDSSGRLRTVAVAAVADGADVAEGALADAVVAAGAAGSVSAKLRRLTTDTDAGNTLTGAVTEAAPATDTASSGLNGRLQRIAQRITSLIALLPAALVGGRLDVNLGGAAGTVTDTNSGVKSAGTLRVVLATDQPALTNKLLVTPDSVALPANQSVNVAQVAGTTADTNSGNKSAGTLRVVLATDQPALSTSMPVDTELPAAAALADAAANPTTSLVGACLMVWQGVNTWARLRAADTHKDLSAVAIGSIATVWTPASGKKVRFMGMTISVSAACSILVEDNAGGTTVWRTSKLLADTPYNMDLGQGYLLASANNVLKFTSSAAANITGTVYGLEE